MSFGGPGAKSPFTDAEIDEYARTYQRPEVLSGGFELYRTLDQDERDNTAVTPVRTPTLLLTAQGSLASTRPTLAPLLTDIERAVEVPRSGHWLMEENPGFVTAELLTFLPAEPQTHGSRTRRWKGSDMDSRDARSAGPAGISGSGEEVSYDVVVVGGGAAGLGGALALGRARRSVLVLDAGHPRNAPATHAYNYLGRDGTPPLTLLAEAREEVARYGVEVRTGTAVAARKDSDGFRVALADGPSVRAGGCSSPPG